MGYIKLKKLTVTGPNVEPSSIEFGEKLTIIAGPSDVGKTYIFRCVDYVLGAKNDNNNLPLDEGDGYDTISLDIKTDEGTATLTRKLKTNVIDVVSNIDGIASTSYVSTASKKNPHTFNELFLKMLDAPLDLKLPNNDKGGVASFTWRTILNAFFIEEEVSDRAKSIILAEHNEPLYLASLIYMITQDELDDYKDDKDAVKIKKARKTAVLEYIAKQKEKLEKKRNEIQEKLSLIGTDVDIQVKIDELNSQLIEVNQKIEEITNNNKKFLNEVLAIQERLSKNKAILSKYTALQSQYASDISRLTFIVENEVLLKSKKTKTKCPFCDSEMIPHDHTAYVQASQAELVKVIQNSNDLENAVIDLKNQIDDDDAIVTDYQEQIDENKASLHDLLIPQKNDIIQLLNAYQTYVQLTAQLESMKEYDVDLQTDMDQINAETITEFKKFKGKDILYPLIRDDIIAYSKDILEKVGYSPIVTVDFVKAKFDIVVNDKMKTNRSKGFKAFTNSIVLLALRKLFEEKAHINPHVYFFDSPLKGLYLPEGDEMTNNIRKGYFEYLADLVTNDQIIVIENTKDNELPNFEFNETAKVYKFTKTNEGRYGFLLSVKN